MARPTKLLAQDEEALKRQKRSNAEIAERIKKEQKLAEMADGMDMSDIPPYLDELAKQEWFRIIPLMEKLPVSELDRTALAQYCVYTSVFIQATNMINEQGIVTPDGKQHPAVYTMNNASKELKGLANSLGLNINSRMKIVVPDNNQEEEEDPIAALMKARQR